MRRFLILVLSLSLSFTAFGQDTIVKRFPDGRVQEIRVLVNGVIVKATKYHIITVKSIDIIGTQEYCLQFTWDKQTKTIESYWSIYDTDALQVLFFKQYSDYTLKQHYGNGPLFYIANYKNKVLDGDYEEYDETGKLVDQGQCSNSKKVGVWKYYDRNGHIVDRVIMRNGNDDDPGISITYTIIPSIVAFLIALVLGIFITIKFSYKTFYIYYCCGVIIFSILFPAIVRLFGRIAEYPLFVWLVIMFLLSIINLYADKKTNVKMRTSFIFLLAALVIYVFYFIIFTLADMSSAAGAAVLFG